jgi:hypothetical protein
MTSRASADGPSWLVARRHVEEDAEADAAGRDADGDAACPCQYGPVSDLAPFISGGRADTRAVVEPQMVCVRRARAQARRKRIFTRAKKTPST